MEKAKAKEAIISTINPHTSCMGRICSLAAGSNLLYIGTVGGDILVSTKSDGRILEEKKWRQRNTPIEGIMYDFEGKVIYATEFNLVILDKNMETILKEVRSFEPLRNSLSIYKINLFSFNPSNWKTYDSYS